MVIRGGRRNLVVGKHLKCLCRLVGLGHSPLTAVTRVRISLEVPDLSKEV